MNIKPGVVNREATNVAFSSKFFTMASLRSIQNGLPPETGCTLVGGGSVPLRVLITLSMGVWQPDKGELTDE